MILEVIDNKLETYDTRTIRFKIVEKAAFKPGQFAMLSLDVIRDGSNKIERKPYSIASIPGKDYIDITVKKHNPGPFGTRLHSLKPGEKVQVEFPFGLFTYTPNLGNNLVLIGAGSGIVPLMSIIRYNTEHNPKAIMRLIYINKTSQDIIFHKDILDIEKSNNNFKAYLATTQDESWQGLQGRLDEARIKELVPDSQKALFYICGPPVMVNDTVRLLTSLGIDRSRIKTERFD